MWLLDYMTQKGKSTAGGERGKVNVSSADSLGVVASNDFRFLKQASPYGVVSVPPKGENAVVLPLKDCRICLGTLSESKELEPGELVLFSKGGAEIYLCNNGKVYINGKEF